MPAIHDTRPAFPEGPDGTLPAGAAPGTAAAALLSAHGFARMTPSQLLTACGVSRADAEHWRAGWERLPMDAWMRDGGRYRRRRHSCWIVGAEPPADSFIATPVPHRAHWQPVDYNALHGGIERMFEPMEEATRQDPAWLRMLTSLGAMFAKVTPVAQWYVEAHQFRINTEGGLGRPTPEGAHRDGVDFVAVILAGREGVTGGETRVFDAHGPAGLRFVMEEPWSAVLLDDYRVIHETTPIQPSGPNAHRDTLVLTYRADGFQAPQ